MKKILSLLFCLFSLPAIAADNALIVTPGVGLTMRSIDIGGGVQSSGVNLVGAAGLTILGTAGTSNAAVLSVQGIASGTALPVSSTTLATEATLNSLLSAAQAGVGNTASAVPTAAVYMGVNVGGNLVGVAPGTAGTASTQVATVQGIASMTPLLANPGTAANWAVGATAASVPANAHYQGLNVGGNLVGRVGDPCEVNAKVYLPISQATNTQLITGTSAKKIYICHIFMIGADAENVSVVAGTGTVCATNTVAVIGATTAAAGPNLSANGGFGAGGGQSSIAATTVNADNLCLFQSGSGRIAGSMAYVVQ